MPGDRRARTVRAATLRSIADDGPDAFYRGEFARALETEMIAGGGLLRADDLAGYSPRVYDEEPRTYRGYRYVSAGDQVAYEALNIIDAFDVASFDPGGADFRHLMAESLGHAFADNLSHYGDPWFVRSPLAGLASPAFGRARAENLRMDRAAARPIAVADPWPYDDGAPKRETAHIAVRSLVGPLFAGAEPCPQALLQVATRRRR